ncbi:MAG: hypothetical protein AABZ57_05730, partial [Candidatus Margulisiibacteriota bacterium]
MKPLESFELTIDKLHPSGYGIAEYDSKSVIVWNSLPGEKVLVKQIGRKKGRIAAAAEKILSPSPCRIDPIEDHYLSCSPWSIMTWEAENRCKGALASNNIQNGYRNKMEFSFAADDFGNASLAFFERGGRRKIPIDGCILAAPQINETAKQIVEWINQKNINPDDLKCLILRSDSAGKVIAGLFVKT